MSENPLKPKSRNKNLVVQTVGREVLVYDLKSNKAFCLNETSAAVWRKCDGTKVIGDIVKEMRFEVDLSIDENFVKLALDQFDRNDLLKMSAAISGVFTGASRRETIRKVGMTSLVALPIVSFLVAPTPGQAQSGPVCPANPCRCPNASTVCNGSTSGMFANCFSSSGNNPGCDCIGPFNPPDSGGTGYKSSQVGCTQTP